MQTSTAIGWTMEPKMSSLLKIGELAKQTGLSVRTLHYYDEIGLLVPSHRTEADHRLYSDADIMRLLQILSLRQLGFSLREIQDCLENPEYSLPQVIELHCDRIRQQMALSQTLLKRLNGIAQDLQTTQSVAVETLIETMETMTMTDTFDYILKAVAFASLAEEVMLQPSAQNYTPEALQVLDLGQSAVQVLNLDVFGTEAMLLGLLAEGTSVAAQTLATAGLTVESAVYITHDQAEAMTMGTRIAVASRRFNILRPLTSHPAPDTVIFPGF
jgi:DNA-binding transcriptional MerR regulator